MFINELSKMFLFFEYIQHTRGSGTVYFIEILIFWDSSQFSMSVKGPFV